MHVRVNHFIFPKCLAIFADDDGFHLIMCLVRSTEQILPVVLSLRLFKSQTGKQPTNQVMGSQEKEEKKISISERRKSMTMQQCGQDSQRPIEHLKTFGWVVATATANWAKSNHN